MSIPNYYRTIYSEKDYQLNQLFQQMKSSMSKAYQSSQIPVTEYDDSGLADVGKDLDLQQSLSDAAAMAEAYARDKADAEQEDKDAKKATTNKEDSDGSWLAMIFQVIPIGIKVIKNGKKLTQGFKEISRGLIDLVKNLAISAVIFFVDSMVFAGEWFYYVFTLILCSVLNLTNIHKCIIFYLFDLFLFSLKMLIISLLFAIDIFFNMKTWLGMSCVDMFYMGLDMIEQFDDYIYQQFQIHVVHYPDFLINLCYRCEAMGDTSGFYAAKKKVGYDVTVMLPEKVGEPIAEIRSGITNVAGIFSLK